MRGNPALAWAGLQAARSPLRTYATNNFPFVRRSFVRGAAAHQQAASVFLPNRIVDVRSR